MSFPVSLQRVVDEALKYIEQQPQHEYHPEKRRDVFDTLMKFKHQGARTRGWLAILTAKHVFHMFDITPEQMKEDVSRGIKLIEQAKKSLKIAELTMQGQYDPVDAYNIVINENYNMNQYTTIFLPSSTGSAVDTCDSALFESSCYHSYNPEYKTHDTFWNSLPHLYDSNHNRITGDSLTNQVWRRYGGIKDTSLHALLAFAWDSKNKTMMPPYALEFWRWWLQEAIPQAWAMAEDDNL